jgi:hypothetical protein
MTPSKQQRAAYKSAIDAVYSLVNPLTASKERDRAVLLVRRADDAALRPGG